jgi:DNA ligase-1
MEKRLPELFILDSQNKQRIWKCWVINDTLYREYGLVGPRYGKLIKNERSFEGKSIGKKNETSSDEQAWAEAHKEWISHIDKGYLPNDYDEKGQKLLLNINVEKKKTGGRNINSVAVSGARAKKTITRDTNNTCIIENLVETENIIPMKAQVWELNDSTDPYSVKQKVSKYFLKNIGKGKFEPTDFYIQPKLDGYRARVMIQKKGSLYNITMTSNSGKQYPWFSSLRKLFIKWLSPLDFDNIIDGLDGELYCKNFINIDGSPIDALSRFSTIQSICGLSRSNPHELEDQIQFHCFDLIDKSGKFTQVQRFQKLNNLFTFFPEEAKDRIIRVETLVLKNISQIPDNHNKYIDMGYEGIIIRSFGLMYKTGKRSCELRKFKDFIDEEYEIVGCSLDKGVSKEHFVWVLKNEEETEFNAKPTGNKEEKLKWYENRKKYIGLFMTIKYQELTEDGIPRFGVAKGLRSGKGCD